MVLSVVDLHVLGWAEELRGRDSPLVRGAHAVPSELLPARPDAALSAGKTATAARRREPGVWRGTGEGGELLYLRSATRHMNETEICEIRSETWCLRSTLCWSESLNVTLIGCSNIINIFPVGPEVSFHRVFSGFGKNLQGKEKMSWEDFFSVGKLQLWNDVWKQVRGHEKVVKEQAVPVGMKTLQEGRKNVSVFADLFLDTSSSCKNHKNMITIVSTDSCSLTSRTQLETRGVEGKQPTGPFNNY